MLELDGLLDATEAERCEGGQFGRFRRVLLAEAKRLRRQRLLRHAVEVGLVHDHVFRCDSFKSGLVLFRRMGAVGILVIALDLETRPGHAASQSGQRLPRGLQLRSDLMRERRGDDL